VALLRAHSGSYGQLREAFPTFLEERHRPVLEAMIRGLNRLVGPEMQRQLDQLLSSIQTLAPSFLPGVPADTLSTASQKAREVHTGALALAALSQLASIFVLHSQDPRYPSADQPSAGGWLRYEVGTPLIDNLP